MMSMIYHSSKAMNKHHSNDAPKTMPQFPIIPLKGYIYHSPTRQAGIAPCVPLCPEVDGQGNRDTPPHTRERVRI